MTALLSDKQVASIVGVEDAKITLWVGAVSAGKTIASLFAFLFAVTNGQGHRADRHRRQDAADHRAEHPQPA
jgi:hypothetical protein